MSRTFFVLSIKSKHFIIRWHHHCSLPTLILYTNCFSILHPFHKSFPVFLPVFHRIKMHLAICITVGVTGFEPAASRSQSECSTKLSYTPSNSAYQRQYPMRIKSKEDTTKDGTYNCSSFIVFVNCFVNHFLALLLCDVVLRFDFIHSMTHGCPIIYSKILTDVPRYRQKQNLCRD